MSAITTMLDLMNENERLRNLLRQQEEELNKAKLLVLQLSRDERSPVQDYLLFSNLTAQLAAMTAERDEVVKLSRYAVHEALLSTGHTKDEHTASVFGQWHKAIDDAIKAEQQLAAAQARCAQLEGWLRFIKRDDSDAGTWESADESCVDFYRNCDMALEGKPIPTERPPIDIKRFEQAPCFLCGYNGGGYYQPDTHPCAREYHQAIERPPA